jgi:hypothetical protein
MTLFSGRLRETRQGHRDAFDEGREAAGSGGSGALDAGAAPRRLLWQDCHDRESDGMSRAGGQEARLHTPGEITAMLGGISIKTLTDLIRDRGLQTTTLGYAPPSRKGGPRRRIWAMTDAQLESLLAARQRRGRAESPG